jgi:dTDP-4-dehydrorhamnose reductase
VPEPRRLVVTGGSGYLGQVLAGHAAAAGWAVTATTKSQAGPARLDVRDRARVRALLDTLRPAAVVHTAYVQQGPGAWDVTATASGVVAEEAAAVGARLVHLSTDVVFDGRAGRPYREDDPVSPLSDYGRAKAEAERLVAAADPGAVLVRTSLIYGGPGRSPSKHERAATDPSATFHTDELRCPAQVDDLALALLELCGAGLAGVAGPLHVAGPDGVSRCELAALVAGHPVRGKPAPPGRPLDCRLDSSVARGLLSTRLRGVHEVLAASR